MTMVYLANVPSIETALGLDFYSPHAHVALEYPSDGCPYYAVMPMAPYDRFTHDRDFLRLDDALDCVARLLKQSEPA